MAFFFASEINRRSSNEDSYCQMEIHMNAEAVVKAMVVADGMGGLSGGQILFRGGSKSVVQELLQTLMSDRFKGNPLDRQIVILQEFSEEIYSKLNQGLYKKGLDAGTKGGTTLSAVFISGYIYCIKLQGQSIYHASRMEQLSLSVKYRMWRKRW